ncbi:MAG: flagellar protein FlgN, partial [Lachnospiraceae bacterium]|nr:flagellar protein FlgN [Lachnospiraceae bacterium]
MASLMENLEDILDRERKEYEDLLEVSLKKSSVIVKGDLEALNAITEEEQQAVVRINRLDKEREKIMNDVARVLNMDVKELKLSDLLQVLERRPQERQKFAASYDRVKRAVLRMKEVNEQNRQLV